MKVTKALTPSIRLIISLSLFVSTVVYTYTNNIDPVSVIYAAILITAVNIIISAPKSLLATLITVVQALYLTSMVYVLQTALEPSYSILFAMLSLLISVGIAIALNIYALGRLWINQIIVYVIFDTGITMSFFASMAQQNDVQILYLIIAFLFPILFILSKNSIISRRKVKPVFNSNTSKNTILHAKISKMLKSENIENKTIDGFITRCILAGDRIVFLYEPASIGKTRITDKGLTFDNQDYSTYLEEFIKQSINTANTYKINKNKIMPIVVLHDYKDNKILNVKVYSNIKPDTSIGSVYLCSPKGLIKLINNLSNNSKPKAQQNINNKYELIK